MEKVKAVPCSNWLILFPIVYAETWHIENNFLLYLTMLLVIAKASAIILP